MDTVTCAWVGDSGQGVCDRVATVVVFTGDDPAVSCQQHADEGQLDPMVGVQPIVAPVAVEGGRLLVGSYDDGSGVRPVVVSCGLDGRWDTELVDSVEFADSAYVQAACDQYASDSVEIDSDAQVSRSGDGAWVGAWVWVPVESVTDKSGV